LALENVEKLFFFASQPYGFFTRPSHLHTRPSVAKKPPV
jgi:hypothetical protein